MDKITSYDSSLARNVFKKLSSEGPEEETGRVIGDSLGKIEKQLIKLYAEDKPENSGAIQALQIKYQRALRAVEGFMQLMRSMHEIMMSGIRNLRLS